MSYLTLGTLAVGTFLSVFAILGVWSAVRAILTARTSQGAIAWAAVLVTWPVISVPVYWALGRSRFHGQVRYRRGLDSRLDKVAQELRSCTAPHVVEIDERFVNAHVLGLLSPLPIVQGNDTELLINGPQTFEAIFAAIDRARHYVLAEFYIVNDDDLGREFKKRLIAAANRGCHVYLLYDDVGSRKMTHEYRAELRDAGVEVTGMKTTKGRGNRFQLNFRNHRKIVVIDGKEAFIGGTNVGDEYVHGDKRLTPWRDTHMRITGPAAVCAQFSFIEDWHWATESIPEVTWDPEVAANGSDKPIFILPSGPDDVHETCGMFFTHCINIAKKRLWIASPYFVPDEGVVNALQLAAMRGVDVRILIPGLADKWLVKQAAMSYVPEVTRDGVKMFEYGEGFIHEKVMLVDDSVSVIGTANFDNRSFRLNFEISVVTYDRDFAGEVKAMLEDDFSKSTQLDPDEVASRSTLFHVGSRVARLFSPVL